MPSYYRHCVLYQTRYIVFGVHSNVDEIYSVISVCSQFLRAGAHYNEQSISVTAGYSSFNLFDIDFFY